MNVLIADDSRAESFFLSQLLLRHDIHSDIVMDGDEAILASRKQKYDIIFLDTVMPGSDGIMAFEGITSDEANPNASSRIIFTGRPVPEGMPSGVPRMDKPVIYASLISEVLSSSEPVSESQTPDISPSGIPVWLDEIPGLDTEAGITHCGSPEGYMEAIYIFFSMIDQKAEEIERLYSDADITNYTIKVHALKSSARIIGADTLADDAFTLEMAGKQDDMETISEKTEDLLNDYRRYRQLLSRLEGDSDGGDSTRILPDVPDDMIRDAYNSLEDFANSMDFELCNMVLESLKEYNLSDDDAALMKEINKKLMTLDWHGIKTLVSNR